jgi:hypothetical protein
MPEARPEIHLVAVERDFTVPGEMTVSEENPYRVYVTHLFQENEDYQRVFEYLQSRENFFFASTSNPDKIPAAGGSEAIKEELLNQIKPAEVVIMPIAMYELNPELMRYQIDVAEAHKKAVVGLKAFGDTMAIKKELLDGCSDIVDWNDRAIINAIKKWGRGEKTAEWETLEFTLD